MDSELFALFGESEKGDFREPYYLETLHELHEALGLPPDGSAGIHYAVRALLYGNSLLFFRVQEEGFSHQDYFEGLWMLKKTVEGENLLAVGIPGVGSQEVIHAVGEVCEDTSSLILITEDDLYDYLTDTG